ncbi:MAG: NTP transferase domain-containing protein, partial [Armatimonadetes bacterium]|nr:NTP transferase domain-containing protein [Armatimonadota bacterium]
ARELMQEHTSRQKERVAAVVLAAGKGTRMGDAGRAKVCHEVAPGRTAIGFLIEQLRRAGVGLVCVVVGARAEQVMQDVADSAPEVLFAYQRELLGTGHAAWCGARALVAAGAAETFLIAMGDKMTTAAVVRGLLEQHRHEEADLTFAVSPRVGESEQGRVVVGEEGRVLGIVEVPDLVAARAWREIERAFDARASLPAAEVGAILRAALPPSGKVPKIMRELLDAAARGGNFTLAEARALAPAARATVTLAGAELDPDWVEAQAPWVNEALYAFSARALERFFASLSFDTAQGEGYLPDAVAVLASAPEGFVVRAYEVPAGALMGFNTPAELDQVRESVQQWLGRQGRGD